MTLAGPRNAVQLPESPTKGVGFFDRRHKRCHPIRNASQFECEYMGSDTLVFACMDVSIYPNAGSVMPAPRSKLEPKPAVTWFGSSSIHHGRPGHVV